ncbi:uncharacterized protein B0I36DRAFT_427200 [Microdochium trichocladiopsis]|uniref:Uncharacterized protein n=1 Tax=Microdochium trichocladiopsis TaxID=1682393 RepID=A0A9P9BWR5_9PEZI|nr:uncharacterized protein B0I36DRAFT_427200 [Microdochium trichocladiopsis]KAH7040860.1 hypothetical protein B0I36DRAFT_427200 [Microdochium trichocladiopsis]
MADKGKGKEKEVAVTDDNLVREASDCLLSSDLPEGEAQDFTQGLQPIPPTSGASVEAQHAGESDGFDESDASSNSELPGDAYSSTDNLTIAVPLGPSHSSRPTVPRDYIPTSTTSTPQSRSMIYDSELEDERNRLEDRYGQPRNQAGTFFQYCRAIRHHVRTTMESLGDTLGIFSQAQLAARAAREEQRRSLYDIPTHYRDLKQIIRHGRAVNPNNHDQPRGNNGDNPGGGRDALSQGSNEGGPRSYRNAPSRYREIPGRYNGPSPYLNLRQAGYGGNAFARNNSNSAQTGSRVSPVTGQRPSGPHQSTTTATSNAPIRSFNSAQNGSFGRSIAGPRPTGLRLAAPRPAGPARTNAIDHAPINPTQNSSFGFGITGPRSTDPRQPYFGSINAIVNNDYSSAQSSRVGPSITAPRPQQNQPLENRDGAPSSAPSGHGARHTTSWCQTPQDMGGSNLAGPTNGGSFLSIQTHVPASNHVSDGGYYDLGGTGAGDSLAQSPSASNDGGDGGSFDQGYQVPAPAPASVRPGHGNLPPFTPQASNNGNDNGRHDLEESGPDDCGLRQSLESDDGGHGGYYDQGYQGPKPPDDDDQGPAGPGHDDLPSWDPQAANSGGENERPHRFAHRLTMADSNVGASGSGSSVTGPRPTGSSQDHNPIVGAGPLGRVFGPQPPESIVGGSDLSDGPRTPPGPLSRRNGNVSTGFYGPSNDYDSDNSDDGSQDNGDYDEVGSRDIARDLYRIRPWERESSPSPPPVPQHDFATPPSAGSIGPSQQLPGIDEYMIGNTGGEAYEMTTFHTSSGSAQGGGSVSAAAQNAPGRLPFPQTTIGVNRSRQSELAARRTSVQTESVSSSGDFPAGSTGHSIPLPVLNNVQPSNFVVENSNVVENSIDTAENPGTDSQGDIANGNTAAAASAATIAAQVHVGDDSDSASQHTATPTNNASAGQLPSPDTDVVEGDITTRISRSFSFSNSQSSAVNPATQSNMIARSASHSQLPLPSMDDANDDVTNNGILANPGRESDGDGNADYYYNDLDVNNASFTNDSGWAHADHAWPFFGSQYHRDADTIDSQFEYGADLWDSTHDGFERRYREGRLWSQNKPPTLNKTAGRRVEWPVLHVLELIREEQEENEPQESEATRDSREQFVLKLWIVKKKKQENGDKRR